MRSSFVPARMIRVNGLGQNAHESEIWSPEPQKLWFQFRSLLLPLLHTGLAAYRQQEAFPWAQRWLREASLCQSPQRGLRLL